MKGVALLLSLLVICAGCTKQGGDASSTDAAGIAVGVDAPEINAGKWLNTDDASVTLASMKGKVVVVEFWATWCPPCRQSIPHLIKLSDALKDQGVVFIGLTDEDYEKAKIEKFVKDMKMEYIVGTGSSSGKDYGVVGIPSAFVLDKKGKVVWKGHPMNGLDKALDKAVNGGTFPMPATSVPADPPARKVNTGT